MTLAQTRSTLETRTAIDGKSIDEHNKMLALDLAMKYINAGLINKMVITLTSWRHPGNPSKGFMLCRPFRRR
uniref:Uncharacterized protein n=1 Tax=Glossina pallidipes TaxID=7398 RepID=A0A1A9ZHS0_GLOPL